ncbi:hypothetical protein HWT44_001623, partial [Campylobacter coli]|nr:hypothetical protein [Campylobacter coli]
KIILSEKQYNFPYVNIFEDKIENNFTASFIKNEDRKKAKEHLKAIFLNANHLFIYDKFIFFMIDTSFAWVFNHLYE